MTNSAGNLEAASNAELGRVGTTYPGAFNARGFENSDFATISGKTLEFSMRITQSGDWIRLVTAPVPVPSVMLLFGTGLNGLIAFRGMKKK